MIAGPFSIEGRKAQLFFNNQNYGDILESIMTSPLLGASLSDPFVIMFHGILLRRAIEGHAGIQELWSFRTV